jgi:predicted Zn-ribbon and HTH transcriptional regulator
MTGSKDQTDDGSHIGVVCRSCGKFFDLLRYPDRCPYCHIEIPVIVVDARFVRSDKE